MAGLSIDDLPRAVDGLIDKLAVNADGLIPAIAQQHDTGEVLMLAWMNAESLRESIASGRVVYWSRSRQALWRKGDTSGHVQRLVDIRVDCDADALLLLVDQTGPACHTGRRSCFYTALRQGQAQRLTDRDALPGRSCGDPSHRHAP